MNIPFIKMHGLGNDFIIFDNEFFISLTPSEIFSSDSNFVSIY